MRFQWAVLYGLFMSMTSKTLEITMKRRHFVQEALAGWPGWLVLAIASEQGRFVLYCQMWEVIGSSSMVQNVRWSCLLVPEPKTHHTFAVIVRASMGYRVYSKYRLCGCWLKDPLVSGTVEYRIPHVTVLLALLEHGYPYRGILRFSYDLRDLSLCTISQAKLPFSRSTSFFYCLPAIPHDNPQNSFFQRHLSYNSPTLIAMLLLASPFFFRLWLDLHTIRIRCKDDNHCRGAAVSLFDLVAVF